MVPQQKIDDPYRFLIDRISDGIVVADHDGIVLFVNPAAAVLLDRARSELLGEPIGLPVIGADFAEVNLVRRDGRRSFAELRVVDSEWDGKPAYIFSLRDVTLRHEAAEERTEHQRLLAEKERQILQSQKMDAVGRLAGGIAHDFNNMLSIIISHASLIKADNPADAQSHAEDIMQTSERAARLVRQLLTFSRNQIFQPRVWNLNDVVRGTVQLFKQLLPENIDVIFNLSEDAGNVKVDHIQIDQALVNLLVNARDAMPEGGKITIETASAKGDAVAQFMPGSGGSGIYTVLRITDTGHGMTPEIQEQAFEPFFTTKGPGKGTGLGLSTVYGVVTQSGGYVGLSSEPGKGTCVEILLPSVDEEPQAEMHLIRSKSESQRNKETILVVEDERGLREVVCEILRQNGYTVLAAGNGKDALNVIEKHEGELHALVTDLVMPEMGGIELVERLHQSRPDLPTIYVSGYSDHRIQRGPLIECLEKPFHPEVLLSTLRNLLDDSVESSGCKVRTG
ncbi:MAG TPA: ATP-binding protein [Candidatus Angelobacter sp.]|nr:ATP-binding protein [Candidatus Angelobacter sp.]